MDCTHTSHSCMHRISRCGAKLFSMRFRATDFRVTWTSFLAVFLLSFCSASSACALQCNLIQPTPCCASASSDHKAMDAMPGMEHVSVAIMPLVSDGATCRHLVCSKAPILPAERNQFLPHPAPNRAVVLHEVAWFAPNGELSATAVRGPPPIPLSSPISLHIVSRV